MARTALYQKILDEAAQDRARGESRPAAAQRPHRMRPCKPTNGAATGIVSDNLALPGPLELREASLAELAAHVYADHRRRERTVHYAAEPYLAAMRALDCVSLDRAAYGQDSASSIVRYFLSNARSWTGPVARVVKAELNRRLTSR